MSTLKINAAAQCAQLTAQGLTGIASPKITLTSDDGTWMVTVPRAAFGNMPISPGDTIVCSVSLVRVAVENEILRPKLMLNDIRKDN